MVYEVRRAVPSIPIIGMGGVMTGTDALEFMMAGANAVGVGTAIFADPQCLLKIPQQMQEWLDDHGVADVNEIVDSLEHP